MLIQNLMQFSSAFAPTIAARWAFWLFTHPQRFDLPKSELEFYNTSTKLTLKNKLRAYQWGEKNQPIILLAHGWNGRGTQLGAFAQPLLQAGFQVIALDGPAHGESPGRQTNPHDFAMALISTQKELGPLHGVVAHSFGAGCSVYAAQSGLDVKRLALVASPCDYDQIVLRFASFIGLNPQGQNYFVKMMESKTGMPLNKMNVGELGRQLKMPILLAHDRDDKEVSFIQAEKIMTACPEAQLLATQGLGHRRILRDPNVLQSVTDFFIRPVPTRLLAY